jgi:hypothetical protein
MTSVRLSILSLYIQLFSNNKRTRAACYVLMATCLLWAIGEILVVFILCQPFAFNWDKTIAGKCGNLNAAYLTVHASNFVIDSSIALLPTPVLWGLKLPTAKKLGVMLMFALGALYVLSFLFLFFSTPPLHFPPGRAGLHHYKVLY